jgi:hypothetical protein
VRYTVTIKSDTGGTQSWINVGEKEVLRILLELLDRLDQNQNVIIEIKPEN